MESSIQRRLVSHPARMEKGLFWHWEIQRVSAQFNALWYLCISMTTTSIVGLFEARVHPWQRRFLFSHFFKLCPSAIRSPLISAGGLTKHYKTWRLHPAQAQRWKCAVLLRERHWAYINGTVMWYQWHWFSVRVVFQLSKSVWLFVRIVPGVFQGIKLCTAILKLCSKMCTLVAAMHNAFDVRYILWLWSADRDAISVLFKVN